MAGKISEMSDASALDGSEQLEVVQSGANKKVTVNDFFSDVNTDIVFTKGAGRVITIADQTVDATPGYSLEIQGGKGLNQDGGNVTIRGGDVDYTGGVNEGRGGGVYLRGADTYETAAAGGLVELRAGNNQLGGDGGPVQMFAGNGHADGGLAGDVNMTAGNAKAVDAKGGNVLIRTGINIGDTPGDADGGYVEVTLGQPTGAGVYGGIRVLTDNGSTKLMFDASGAKTQTFPNANGTIALETAANGTFSVITSITVVNGIITNIEGT